jgi:hypothetical protein
MGRRGRVKGEGVCNKGAYGGPSRPGSGAAYREGRHVEHPCPEAPKGGEHGRGQLGCESAPPHSHAPLGCRCPRIGADYVAAASVAPATAVGVVLLAVQHTALWGNAQRVGHHPNWSGEDTGQVVAGKLGIGRHHRHSLPTVGVICFTAGLAVNLSDWLGQLHPAVVYANVPVQAHLEGRLEKGSSLFFVGAQNLHRPSHNVTRAKDR